MAIVDSFDAMTSERAYRQQLTVEMATAEIARCTGSQFDPRLVDVLMANLKVQGRNEPVTPAPLGLVAEVAEVVSDPLQAGCPA